jgi:ferritin
MLNSNVQAALNAQINMELSAFYTYLSMAAYFEACNWQGFAAWVRHHAEEEMEHAMKLYDFIHARRGRVTLIAINEPKGEWENVRAAIESALHHEERVTASIHALVDLARSEGDHATESFLKWFVDEQVEEEAVVDAIVQKLNQIGDHASSLYLLDRDLGAQAGEDEKDEE